MAEIDPELSFEEALEAYWCENAETLFADIAALVAIPSVVNPAAAAPGAPFGPEPAKALDLALEMAARMGMEPHNMEGYIGYADLPAAAAGRDTALAGKQVGIIGHVDVVGAGPGWTFDPWTLARKEGWLVGRGVSDDKGPLMVALHALHFCDLWGKTHAQDALPYNTRVIIGTGEETGMDDVPYYQARMADPDFLFTPDAEFPVSYGEKGICRVNLVSAPIVGGALEMLDGGAAPNAVPGEARAVVRGEGELFAAGKSAHASLPDRGESAILKLIDMLLSGESAEALTEPERAFLEMDRRLTASFDGAGAGLACADEDFGPLTLVGGMIYLRPVDAADLAAGVRIVQSIDVRYPTTVSDEAIVATLSAAVGELGGTLELDHVEVPFITSPDSPEVQALISAYRSVTGFEDAAPFTMGGGTYARKFSRAVSFGPEMPDLQIPEWGGGMHAANEVMSEEHLRLAFMIYATAFKNLAGI